MRVVALVAADGGHEASENDGLDEAAVDIGHADGRGDPVEIGPLVHVQHGDAGEIASHDADDVCLQPASWNTLCN